MAKTKLEGLNNFVNRHPIFINVIIIILIAIIGLLIAYFSLTLFTKHGQKGQVPNVVGMSYTEAIEKLHENGFKTEIRDSLYLDNVKPGYVVEQYPYAQSIVKPGRRIFLYINAVNPKRVMIDPSSEHPGSPALQGFGLRQTLAILEEGGFKNVRIKYLPGTTDRVVRILANGSVVKVMEKVPINAQIVVEVYDNKGMAALDSINASRYYEEVQLELLNNSLEPEENPDYLEEPTPAPLPESPEEEEFIEY